MRGGGEAKYVVGWPPDHGARMLVLRKATPSKSGIPEATIAVRLVAPIVPMPQFSR